MERPRFERCWCTGVDRGLVVAAIRAGSLRTFDQVRRGSGACYGCQSCRPELEALIEEVWNGAEEETRCVQRQPDAGEPAGAGTPSASASAPASPSSSQSSSSCSSSPAPT
jgi:bacterioferritin-associated ferredoxin